MNLEYDNFKHLELLKYSETLKTQNKSLIEEDREFYFKLLDYEIRVYDDICWKFKDKLLIIILKFLNNEISLEDFEYYFYEIWHQAGELDNLLEKDVKKLTGFKPNPDSEKFGEILDGIMSECEIVEYDDNEKYNQAWLKKSLENYLLALKK